MSIHTLYLPRNSLIHRLDPRTKVAVWLFIAAPAIISNSILISAAMFCITLLLSFIGEVAVPYAKNIAKVTLPVFVPIILIQGLFYPGGRTPILWLTPALSFKVEGIAFAILLVTRLLAIFGGAYLLNLTTYPGDLMASMLKSGLPLNIAYPLFSALQIVPTIESRLQSIIEAQTSRGLKLQKVSLLQKLKNFVPLLTPLLLGAIEEAYRRSIALEARGFSSKVKKTFLRDLKIRPLDIIFITLTVTFVLIVSATIFIATPRPNIWNL